MMGVANLGQRVAVLLGQRWTCGEVDGRLEQCVKDCSIFFEGKEELGVEKALFNVGLSACCGRGGEVDMAARCAVSCDI